ncbi:MAG TPA: L,D-transpeptidase [Methylobacter sp.]|jgi:lipoprotein-anchoring transpeptidase ErfK/SrfK
MDSNPGLHGCIRMKNADVLELFNRIEVGVKVYIHE